jgi:hypothetical protein
MVITLPRLSEPVEQMFEVGRWHSVPQAWRDYTLVLNLSPTDRLMTTIAGVDGCRGDSFVVESNSDHTEVQGRSSSVLSAPIRRVLDAVSRAAASAPRRGIEGKRMSIQVFVITGKVKEVDTALRSRAHACHVFEVHPEVSFVMMNGSRLLEHAKKRAIGRAERLALLASDFGDATRRLITDRPKHLVAAAAVLDAFGALWTARRIARGACASTIVRRCL